MNIIILISALFLIAVSVAWLLYRGIDESGRSGGDDIDLFVQTRPPRLVGGGKRKSLKAEVSDVNP